MKAKYALHDVKAENDTLRGENEAWSLLKYQNYSIYSEISRAFKRDGVVRKSSRESDQPTASGKSKDAELFLVNAYCLSSSSNDVYASCVSGWAGSTEQRNPRGARHSKSNFHITFLNTSLLRHNSKTKDEDAWTWQYSWHRRVNRNHRIDLEVDQHRMKLLRFPSSTEFF